MELYCSFGRQYPCQEVRLSSSWEFLSSSSWLNLSTSVVRLWKPRFSLGVHMSKEQQGPPVRRVNYHCKIVWWWFESSSAVRTSLQQNLEEVFSRRFCGAGLQNSQCCIELWTFRAQWLYFVQYMVMDPKETYIWPCPNRISWASSTSCIRMLRLGRDSPNFPIATKTLCPFWSL